ncbi:uncharacterized protein LODBEIA_P06030 [Lodderomyces beijingensis]|uniref:Uncharacterized protein n=1 Tax=Lodderomyces beijingensis TaxID=1775926 RepID=A0ABP0ZET8_9ASCO
MSGGLSSRVMNMKFMQKADNLKQRKVEAAEERQDEESSRTKVLDTSEWSLPISESILKRASRKPRTQSVGYGQIMSDVSYFRKRSWGGSLQIEELSSEAAPSRSRKTDANQDLSSMWRKRKLDDGDHYGKKRMHRS